MKLDGNIPVLEITGEHLPEIYNEEKAAFDKPFIADFKELESRFNRGHRILVARSHGQIVGKIGFYFGSYDPTKPENLPRTFHEYVSQDTCNRGSNCVYVYNLDVLPAYRNGGQTALNLMLGALRLGYKLGKSYAIGDVNCGAFNGSPSTTKNPLRKDWRFNQTILQWEKSGLVPAETDLNRNPYFKFYSRAVGLKPLVLRTNFAPEDEPSGGYHFYGVTDLKALFRSTAADAKVLPYFLAKDPPHVAHEDPFQAYDSSSYWGQPVPQVLEYLERQKLNGRLFEACCGDGRYTTGLTDKFEELFCSDIDGDSLNRLIGRLPPERDRDIRPIVEDTRQTFSLYPKSADVTACFGALHLFEPEDIQHIIQAFKAITKPSGHIIFDFSANVRRTRPDGSSIELDAMLPNYSLNQAIEMFDHMFPSSDVVDMMIGQIDNLSMGRGMGRYNLSATGFIATLRV